MWLTRWILPVVVVALLAGVSWAAGGFAKAPAVAGPDGALGEQIVLERWTITVERVALVNTDVDGYEHDPAFRVWASITHTGEESQAFLPDRLIEVVVPGGPKPARPYLRGDPRGDQFDPDVPRQVAYDFAWPDSQEDPVPVLPAPDDVSVIVRDEEQSDGYLSGREWGTADPAAVIKVRVDDERVER